MKLRLTEALLKAFRSGIEELEVAEAQGVENRPFTRNGKVFADLLRGMSEDQKTAVIIDLCGRLIVAEGENNELKLGKLG